MPLKKINIIVIGATGFVGLDLVKLLSKHPNIIIKYLCAQKNIGKKIQFFDKRIKKKLPNISKLSDVNWSDLDLGFISLPNGGAQKIVKKILSHHKIKFIDLSADFRLTNPKIFKKWYGINHQAKKLIKYSKYSIPELTKSSIKKYKIIANPGCYPTTIQLPLVPLIFNNVLNLKKIIIDSKSGISGAGKNFKNKFTHNNIDKAIQAYGITKHRHMSEIDQEFKLITRKNINYTFSPHLIPTFRGMLTTIHLELKNNYNASKILKIIKDFHKKNRFIKVKKLNTAIGTGDVINTNFCEISVCESRYKNYIVIYSSIDNLVKGAAGQAIQNMNLLFNFKESAGLL
ncbi:N-acetyl-gamma-glutamyl-phosphate reductase [Pelagibacteraceae bacterium]|nr:N-acetyl-gamma-glutamyl-phosphate reductase [Pelagibacteraceae bacterium]